MRKKLIGYITAGDPTLELSLEIAKTLLEAGVDILELGIPFSDPIADGPIIQQAHCRALASGMTLAKIFDMMPKIRHDFLHPIYLMGSYNSLLAYGLDAFVLQAKAMDVTGTIIPDLPPEEAGDYDRSISSYYPELATVYLISPTTRAARLTQLAKKSRGFNYLVSSTGTTGIRQSFDESLKSLVTKIKHASTNDVYIGFGISTAAQAKALGELGDGVIIGSAIVALIETYASNPSKLKNELTRFIRSIINVL